jgi:uncharacterized protein (TIGR02145 family)
MKYFLFILTILIIENTSGQIQHNINNNSVTITNSIVSIDSIRFDPTSTTMEVVLSNGTISQYPISDIINVTFNYGIGDSANCGAPDVHNPMLNYNSLTDIDGNVYKTVVIGTQEWMAENLKTSHYQNGSLIPIVNGPSAWYSLTNGAACWYNNDSALYECPYGKLYNWYAVTDPRNLCPSGWHVPSHNEWITLQNTLLGNGGAMKSTGTMYWNTPNSMATDSSGFSGLPGGYRGTNGIFANLHTKGYWWSTSLLSNFSAWGRGLNNNNDQINQPADPREFGFSVRCLKD